MVVQRKPETGFVFSLILSLLLYLLCGLALSTLRKEVSFDLPEAFILHLSVGLYLYRKALIIKLKVTNIHRKIIKREKKST